MVTKAEKRALNRKEAAAYLGISEGTLQKLERAGKIKCVRFGRRNFYSIATLESFLNNTE